MTRVRRDAAVLKEAANTPIRATATTGIRSSDTVTGVTTDRDPALAGFHAVVPAGGAGTRLWPLSRAAHPKFLLDLTGNGRSLLQQTWDRLYPLADGVVVVTGASHATAVAEQLPELPASDLLAEPSPRDSAAAIGLAAAVIHRRDPSAVMGSFAADHVIRNTSAFRDAVVEAVVTARAGYVVTIGIEPERPSTAFGYIQLGESLDLPGAPSARAVVRFVEKPDAATAARYVAGGQHRWNAGMFVAPAALLLEQLRENRPELHDGLVEIAAAWDGPGRQEVLERVWPSLEKVAIDYAVAEPAADAGRVAVVPAALGWDDIGDWASLAALLPGDGPLRVLGDDVHVHAVESTGVIVPDGGRLVAVLGLEDVVVIDTPDALLVTTRERAQEVKAIVDHLKQAGGRNLT
ncbi:MAG: mannose-phosphate guanylyltransferase [Actinomycetota bacterium]|nr:mannose-phosphate guanylyltransferase [Actinomycetota bacterium]